MDSPDQIGRRRYGAALSNLPMPSDHSDPRCSPDPPEHQANEPEQGPAMGWSDAVRIATVALAAVAVWLHLWEPLRTVSVIGVLGLLIGGWPVVREAAENALARRMTMELSMTIAILAAAAISEFFTALVITLFVLVAEVLEGMTVSRGRGAIRDLLDFLPRAVAVRRAGAVHDGDATALTAGEPVLGDPRG